VHPGECLYIPSYWFHQVTSSPLNPTLYLLTRNHQLHTHIPAPSTLLQVTSPPGMCSVAVTLWLDLLRVTTRVSREDRMHAPSGELKRRLLRGGGLPVTCARTVRPGEEVDDR
jgi:hypothetical protein